MTVNKSIYQPPSYEIEWIIFAGTEDNKQSIAKWVEAGTSLIIVDDGDEWTYKTFGDYGSSDWDILPLGSFVCRNVFNDYYFVILPGRVEDFKSKLSII